MKSSRIQQLIWIMALCLALLPLAAGANDLSLKEAVQRAVTNNPNLAESRVGIAVAEKGVESAFGRHYPRLSLEGSINKREDPIPYIPAQSTTVPAHFSDGYASLGPVLTINLYQGGLWRQRTWNRIRGNRSSVSAHEPPITFRRTQPTDGGH